MPNTFEMDTSDCRALRLTRAALKGLRAANSTARIDEINTELLHELECAATIIRNAVQVMTVDQKAEWARANKLDKVAGQSTPTRFGARWDAIQRAKDFMST